MKNKYTAAFLAIFLGWLGFHKFYLGKWIQGIFYILFMITFIPFLVSILEGIIYLLNSEKQFDLWYNMEYIRNLEYLNNKK